MNVAVVPLERWHLAALYGEESAGARDQNDQRVSYGLGFAAVIDGRVLGAGGIARSWKGTGTAWTVLTEELTSRHKKSLHKWVRRLFPLLVKTLDLTRVQADALARSGVNCAWLERLGFESEGIMRKYKDGEDYVRFAWVR